MVRLFIENQEIEINNDIQVAITKQFEDLSNPTTIINDWSKTVSIPFSVKNNQIFGHIYRLDRVISEVAGTNYMTAPESIKRWVSGTKSYSNEQLVNGEIVVDYPVDWLHVGFQDNSWKYTWTKRLECNNDSHSFEFVYDYNKNFRFELSFRNNTIAQNVGGEVYFVQWNLSTYNLVRGETYVITFKHRMDGNNYITYDWTLSKKQPIVGINFNPLKKLNFRVEWGSDVLMSGYAKMNDIKQTDGKGTYNITLFGQLGKVFQEMKKITFDTSTSDKDYLINGGDYVSEYITRDVVYKSWTSSGQTTSELKKKGESGYTVTDIIGFAPNNAFSDGFKYDTYQDGQNHSRTFAEYLGEDGTFTEDTGVEADTVIKDGLLPRQIGEYRSYLQLPYIYFNKLFQIFQKQAEELTGYQFELDSQWFNTSNPYWNNLVYMLKPFSTKATKTVTNTYQYVLNPSENFIWPYNETSSLTTYQTSDVTYTGSTEVEQIVDSNNYIHLSDDFDVKINSVIQFSLSTAGARFNPANGLIISICAVDEGGNVKKEVKYLMCDTKCTLNKAQYQSVLTFESKGTNTGTPFLSYPDLKMRLDKSTCGGKVKLQVRVKWATMQPTFLNSAGGFVLPLTRLYFTPQQGLNNLKFDIEHDVHRSHSHFTLNTLWNNEYKLFDEIIKYCKIYRIGIRVNEFTKKIIFEPYSHYFDNYTVSDWTNKVDKSKDYTITPVTFDSKYVLFNYKDSNTEIGKQYKTKYGVNYGDYRLTTQYNFNDGTNNIFDNVTPSILQTDNVLSWKNLKNNHSIVYSFPAEIMVCNKDKDNKQVDIFGAYFFHNGLANFSTEATLYMCSVTISDDTNFQSFVDTYFYNQAASHIEQTGVTTYPKLDIVNGDNLCTFNVPSENYTYLNNYAGKKSIYSNFWETYINERYNIQNKKLTCYVDLKPSDYNQFEWNKLVKIDGQLCIVNKIYDYNVNSNTTTKVDLITIQNIDGYTSDNYNN